MGKREVGQLSITDLIVSLLIAELTVISIENYDKSILYSLIPIVILVLFQCILAFISLKKPKFRLLLDGNPSVIIKNNNSTEKVVLDGANKIVSSSSVRRIFGDDFSWNWLELRDGKNEITVEGNCEVTIEYRTVIKIGEY
jgi:hypothetical protein